MSATEDAVRWLERHPAAGLRRDDDDPGMAAIAEAFWGTMGLVAMEGTFDHLSKPDARLAAEGALMGLVIQNPETPLTVLLEYADMIESGRGPIAKQAKDRHGVAEALRAVYAICTTPIAGPMP